VIPVAIVVLLSVVISVVFFIRRQKQKTESIPLPSIRREFQKISYSDIVRATGGFAASNLIGQGRYGSVYEGQLFGDGIMEMWLPSRSSVLRREEHKRALLQNVVL
jgi:nitric oxide reductase large subunit